MTKNGLFWNRPEIAQSFCQICSKRAHCQRLDWLLGELQSMQIEAWPAELSDQVRSMQKALGESGWSYPESLSYCSYRAARPEALANLSEALADLIVAYDDAHDELFEGISAVLAI